MANLKRVIFSVVCLGYGLFLGIKGETTLANIWLATALIIAQMIE